MSCGSAEHLVKLSPRTVADQEFVAQRFSATALAHVILTRVEYIAVGVGAILGANLRFIAGNLAAEHMPPDFPYGTLIVNISGAFAIGVVLTLIGERAGISPLWRLFLVTGFLGGYTTFSSYAWESLVLVQTGNILPAAVYVLGSNGVGLVGVWLGATLARLSPL